MAFVCISLFQIKKNMHLYINEIDCSFLIFFFVSIFYATVYLR